VTLSDGSGPGRPARLELNNECLYIQIPLGLDAHHNQADQATEVDPSSFVGENARLVTVNRHPETGFGFSIKVISKM